MIREAIRNLLVALTWTNAERRDIVKEFERRQNLGEDVSQRDLAKWAFKELQLTTMPSQPTMSRLCKTL